MIKQFIKWIQLKEKLHNVQKEPPLVKERDLWWISFEENTGSETKGKRDLYSRTPIAFKKLSPCFYLVAPTTTKKKEGTLYVEIKQEGKFVYVCIHQKRIIDYRRLSSKLGQIDTNDFAKIKKAFWELYK